MGRSSPYAAYLAALEAADTVHATVAASALLRYHEEFAKRGWISPSGHLTHLLVPFLDGEVEVEIEVDEDAGIFRYPSPQNRSRIVTRPLLEVQRFRFSIDRWLDDVTRLVGIDPRRHSKKRELVDGHLWHLGDQRIGNSHKHGPVFIVRQWHRGDVPSLSKALSDPIWQNGGAILMDKPTASRIVTDHAIRGLFEFLGSENGRDTFDGPALDRVLQGKPFSDGEAMPKQYLLGEYFKLPHFVEARRLSPERLKIIKAAWGTDGHEPPIVKWAEINRVANTGYQSFDDAFAGDGCSRVDVFDLLRRGQYRLRRSP
ncbi:MAG: hypothetical protein D4S02_16625 [Rhodocyclaceae bacterium]|nr:MAG: hypothetical protein D4S02_16625 [Rhodocyclaceae bacterium]